MCSTCDSAPIPLLYMTSHATTGQSPAELMLGRQLRTRLDLFKLDIPAIELEHTRSGRREPTMFTHKHGSSSLWHRSTSRALAKGCHGSLGSSKSPSTQCLTLLSWKMAASFANMCNVIHGSLESLHSYSTTIS